MDVWKSTIQKSGANSKSKQITTHWKDNDRRRICRSCFRLDCWIQEPTSPPHLRLSLFHSGLPASRIQQAFDLEDSPERYPLFVVTCIAGIFGNMELDQRIWIQHYVVFDLLSSTDISIAFGMKYSSLCPYPIDCAYGSRNLKTDVRLWLRYVVVHKYIPYSYKSIPKSHG